MNYFTDVEKEIKEISSYVVHIAETTELKHFSKLCVIIAVSEFEKSIKEAIKGCLLHPKSSMDKTINILKAMNNNRSDFLYNLLRCNDDSKEKNFLPNVELFFAVLGDGFRKKTNSVFPRYVKKYIQLCKKKLTTMNNTDSEFFELSDEIAKMQLLSYKDAQDSFLELKHIRNKLAHNYLATTAFATYSIGDIVDKFLEARLFVGTLEMTFEFFSTSS